MGLVLRKPNGISCPHCGNLILMEPNHALCIVAKTGMRYPDGYAFLGRIKCARCKGQVNLHYRMGNAPTGNGQKSA